MAAFILTAVDFGSDSFTQSWKKLSPQIQKEAKKAFGEMLLCEQMPAKLHFHKLNGFKDVWTVHVTADDKYKASFSIESNIAKMHRVGLHDWIDKNPR